jgi:hypothetical protein
MRAILLAALALAGCSTTNQLDDVLWERGRYADRFEMPGGYHLGPIHDVGALRIAFITSDSLGTAPLLAAHSQEGSAALNLVESNGGLAVANSSTEPVFVPSGTILHHDGRWLLVPHGAIIGPGEREWPPLYDVELNWATEPISFPAGAVAPWFADPTLRQLVAENGECTVKIERAAACGEFALWAKANDFLRSSLPHAPDNAVGAALLHDEKIVAMDVFIDPGVFRACRHALLRGYSLYEILGDADGGIARTNVVSVTSYPLIFESVPCGEVIQHLDASARGRFRLGDGIDPTQEYTSSTPAFVEQLASLARDMNGRWVVHADTMVLVGADTPLPPNATEYLSNRYVGTDSYTWGGGPNQWQIKYMDRSGFSTDELEQASRHPPGSRTRDRIESDLSIALKWTVWRAERELGRESYEQSIPFAQVALAIASAAVDADVLPDMARELGFRAQCLLREASFKGGSHRPTARTQCMPYFANRYGSGWGGRRDAVWTLEFCVEANNGWTMQLSYGYFTPPPK